MRNEPPYIGDPDAIVTAAYEGAFELVKQLVSDGRDVNETNEFGETAIIAAAENGYTAIIKFLLSRGANVNAKDNDGDTALDIAKYHENMSAVELLLSYGAEVADGPSEKERIIDSYYDAMDYIQSKYFDDRIYVIEIGRVKTRSISRVDDQEKNAWAVITRRNVQGYPTCRCNEFERREDAVAYLKEMAPETPRVSLDGKSPSPTPSWEEYQEWLESIGAGRLPY